MGLTVASAPKQPDEIIIVGFDFSGTNRLAVGDAVVLTGSSVTIRDADGVDVSNDMFVTGSLAVSQNVISCKIENGNHGEEYKITFLVATQQGELLEEDYILPVENL